jgi:hypothetical protein
MYSKGIIPLTAISTVRAQGDNKFEIVTTQRTFVFRVEKEGKIIFSTSFFSPLPHLSCKNLAVGLRQTQN